MSLSGMRAAAAGRYRGLVSAATPVNASGGARVPGPAGPPGAARPAGTRRDLGVTAVVAGWIGAVLSLDPLTGPAAQLALGAGTWLLLVALLAREDGRVRVQVAVVVAFASLIEYTFSGLLHVYVYRLHNVPAFVPPGHGLVYLGALAFGRSAFARARARALVAGTLLAGAGYALWGLTLAPRPDVLGAFWFACLALFVWRGRSPTVFVGAFVLVTYLELVGTRLGVWTWRAHDFTGIVAIGNPPSGAAGGYGFFDAAALAAAPWLSAAAARCRARLAGRPRRVTGAPAPAPR